MYVSKRNICQVLTFLLLSFSHTYLDAQLIGIKSLEKLCKSSADSCLLYIPLYKEKIEEVDHFRLNLLAGYAYSKKGAYQNAIDEFSIAQHSLLDAATSNRDSFMYRIKNQIGVCQDELGDDRQAEKSFFEALQYITKLSDSLEHVARVYTNLAILYTANGNLSAALNYTKAAIEIGPLEKGKEAKWNQIDQMNLFGLHFAMHDFTQALNILKSTRKDSTTQIDEDILTDLHFNFGLCYQALQAYDSAIFHFKEAINKIAATEKDIFFRADKILNLADAYLGARQIGKAEHQTNLVLNMKLPTGAAKQKILAKMYLIKGKIQLMRGDHRNSSDSFRKAWERINIALSRERFSSETLKLLLDISKVYASAVYDSQPTKAANIITDALSHFDIGSILDSETAPLTALNHEYKELYQVLIELIVNKFEDNPDNEELIFKHFQKYNSFQFASKIRSHSLTDTKDKTLQGLQRKIATEKAKLNHFQLNKEQDSIDTHAVLLRSLQLELDIEGNSNHSKRLNNDLNSVSLGSLKRYAQQCESIFTFFLLSNNKLTTLVIDSVKLKVHTVQVPSNFQEQVVSFSELITLYPKAQITSEQAIKTNIKQVNRLSRELFNKILAPVFPINGKRMVISSDGVLARLPFAALSIIPSSDSTSFIGDQFLISHYEISHFNPFSIYDPAHSFQVPQIDIIAPFAVKYRNAMKYYLPGSKKAIDQIADKEVANVIHQGVSKQNLTTLLQETRALHFATHAESSQSQSGHLYLMCGPNPLLFADRFYRDDLIGLSIHSPLITLSGCQTGIGPRQSGQMESLGRAFLLSGAGHLLTTLWNIDDHTNHQIMADFYSGFDSSQGSGAAFSQAIRSYLQGNQGVHLHPFHWAGYQMIDAGSRLKIRSKSQVALKHFLIPGLALGMIGWIVLKRKRVA